MLIHICYFPWPGADAGSVDMATVMAEMFQSGDRNNDEKLTKPEFTKVDVPDQNTVFSGN